MDGKGRTKEEAQKWYDDHLSSHLTSVAKQRAKKKGLPFNITPDDVVIPDKCPLLGIELKRSRLNRGPSDNSPTLDRVSPEKGYVKGNVWVISAKANRIKSDANIDEIHTLHNNLELLQLKISSEEKTSLPEFIGMPKALYESILHSLCISPESSPEDLIQVLKRLISQHQENKTLLLQLENGLEALSSGLTNHTDTEKK